MVIAVYKAKDHGAPAMSEHPIRVHKSDILLRNISAYFGELPRRTCAWRKGRQRIPGLEVGCDGPMVRVVEEMKRLTCCEDKKLVRIWRGEWKTEYVQCETNI